MERCGAIDALTKFGIVFLHFQISLGHKNWCSPGSSLRCWRAVLTLLACSARESSVQCSAFWTLGQALCSSVVAGVQLVPRVTCSSILPPRNCTSTHVYSLQIFLKFSFDGLQQMEKHHKKKNSELRPRMQFYCLLQFTWVSIGVRRDAIWLLPACSSQARWC